METIQYNRHTKAWDGLCDYKELPLVSVVQTLQKNDTEQNSANHRITPN